MTQRELLALGIGLVLIVLGWTMDPGSEHGGAALDDDERSREPAASTDSAPQSHGRAAEPPRSAGAEVGPSHAPRVEAAPRVGPAAAGAADPRASSEPSLEPSAWPTGGLFVRVTQADGAVAVGAPIGVWVVGGRSPLALAESDAEGRVHLTGVPAIAARYEVGLAAPDAQRVDWPEDKRTTPKEGARSLAELGLERAAPLALALPRCGTLEVHVARASRTGTRVELGQGAAASFQVAQIRSADADGVARFAWLPLGLDLTLRVPFDEGTVEAAVAGPTAPPAVGGAPAPVVPVIRRVSVGPEGLSQG